MHDNGRILQLDGLRGVAILLVLCYHCFDYGFLYPVFELGWTGVDLFFVLSGFLITGILFDTKGQKGYYRTFITRRALRILPLYYGVLVAFALVASYSHVTNWFKDYQLYFWTYTNNYLILQKGFLRPLGHFWSLAIEEQFYLFWPWVILLLKPKQVIAISLTLILIGILIRLNATNRYITYGLPFAHLDGLLFGSMAAVFIRQEKDLLFKITDKVLPVSAVLLALYLTLYSLWGNREANTGFYQLPLSFTLIAIIYTSLMVLSLKNRVMAKFLSNRLLLFFGKYSYGMYVFNSIFFHYSNWAGADRLSENRRLIVYSGVFVLTVLISYLSYNLYEVKFLRLKKRFRLTSRILPASKT